VKGTVKVERGATLYASAIRVIGNIRAENARRVNVVRSHIGGSVQIVQSRKGSTLSKLDRNTVKHDVQYFENRGTISTTRNRINGNLQCKATILGRKAEAMSSAEPSKINARAFDAAAGAKRSLKVGLLNSQGRLSAASRASAILISSSKRGGTKCASP
jgi:hypothetical protein